MLNSNRDIKLAESIAKTSPLYWYWGSIQNDEDEEQRLSQSNKDSPDSVLFRDEPYKWEMLYQSIIREVRRGDKDSITGLRFLISMLKHEQQQDVLQGLANNELFNDELIDALKQKNLKKSQTKKNRIRFLRILFAIFTNPYGIKIRRRKRHIYEQTGSTLNSLKQLLQVKVSARNQENR